MLEQLNGPVGIGAAVVVAIILLVVIRKVFSFIFLILAIGLGGWGAARHFDIPIPYVLPHSLAEAADTVRAAMSTEAAPSSADETATAAMVQPESLSRTRSLASAGPSAETAAANALADGLRTAEIKYNAPTTMQLNMPVDLRLVVDTSGMENLDSMLEGLEGEIRGGQAELTNQVSASLTGSGFDIRPLKPERQILSDDRPSTWQWEVTPRAEGVRTLILEVFAHPGDGEAAAGVREFRDEITVEVTLVSRALHFAQTAQPAVGFVAGGVSLLIAFVGLFRRRRHR